MNATPSLPTGLRSQPAAGSAHQMQQRLLRWGLNTLLFLCGACAWVFKLKGDGSSEGGLLPFSPLQVLLPLLGAASVLWLLNAYGGRLPRLLPPLPTARLLAGGIGLILLGGSLHLRAEGNAAAMHMLRWLLPGCFLLFYALSRTYRASPLALLLGLGFGAVLSAASVQAYHSFGASLPVAAPMAGRYGGYLNHPNQYGIICSTSAPIILYFFYGRGHSALLRLGAALLLPVYLLCLSQNLSKTNIVLFLLSLLVGSLALSLKNPRKILLTIGLTFGVAVFLASTVGLMLDTLRDFSPKAVKSLEDAFFDPTDARSMNTREDIWATSISYIKAHPLTGLGPGQTLDALGIDHAHNVLLQLYLDTGLAGFCGITLVILAVFLRAANLFRLELLAREKMDNERMLRLLSGVAMVTYVFANSLSDCFSSATMPVFIFFTVLAFAAEPEPLRSTARPRPRRTPRRAPALPDPDAV